MKYKDDTTNKTVNATYVGVPFGTPMADAIDTGSDGREAQRDTEWFGSVLQDAVGPNPTAKLTSIEITTNPTKLSYVVGSTLDLTGIVVKGTRSGGAVETLTVTTANATGFNSTEAATNQVVTITVDGCTATFKVTITAS